MKIFHSPASPFVRKCMVVAHELGVADRIEKLPSAAGPVKRDATILPKNPLGQVPTFLCNDGQVLYDSRVICEYLDATHSGALFPADGTERWARLTELALADGMTAAALLARYETMLRPGAAALERLDRGPARQGAHRSRMARNGGAVVRRSRRHRHDRLRLRAGLPGLPVSFGRLACRCAEHGEMVRGVQPARVDAGDAAGCRLSPFGAALPPTVGSVSRMSSGLRPPP
jgi:glutathione S-transferase